MCVRVRQNRGGLNLLAEADDTTNPYADLEYLIKWQDHDHSCDSWEPETNLSLELKQMIHEGTEYHPATAIPKPEETLDIALNSIMEDLPKGILRVLRVGEPSNVKSSGGAVKATMRERYTAAMDQEAQCQLCYGTDGKMRTCVICSMCYHEACLDETTQASSSVDWSCPECLASSRKGSINSSKQVREAPKDPSPPYIDEKRTTRARQRRQVRMHVKESGLGKEDFGAMAIDSLSSSSQTSRSLLKSGKKLIFCTYCNTYIRGRPKFVRHMLTHAKKVPQSEFQPQPSTPLQDAALSLPPLPKPPSPIPLPQFIAAQSKSADKKRDGALKIETEGGVGVGTGVGIGMENVQTQREGSWRRVSVNKQPVAQPLRLAVHTPLVAGRKQKLKSQPVARPTASQIPVQMPRPPNNQDSGVLGSTVGATIAVKVGSVLMAIPGSDKLRTIGDLMEETKRRASQHSVLQYFFTPPGQLLPKPLFTPILPAGKSIVSTKRMTGELNSGCEILELKLNSMDGPSLDQGDFIVDVVYNNETIVASAMERFRISEIQNVGTVGGATVARSS